MIEFAQALAVLALYFLLSLLEVITFMISPSVIHLRDRVTALGIPQAYVAALCGLSQAKLSRGFAGLETIPGDMIQRIDGVLRNLEYLVNVCLPIPLDLKQIDKVQELLAKVERGDLGSVVLLPVTKSSSDLLGEATTLNPAHAM